MTSFLVTGGAGFIGSNLVRLLQAEGNTVVVYDALTYSAQSGDNLPSGVRVVEGDVCDPWSLFSAFDEVQPEVVFHLAAETHVDRSIDDAGPFVCTNVLGTHNVLEAALRTESDPLIVHVSTDEVYGSLGPNDPPFTELTRYDPSSPYAATKAAADHLVRAYHRTHGLRTIVTHCSNNYGPFQHAEKLVPTVILNALQGMPLPVYGDGRNVRDWMFVRDHCEALAAIAQRGRAGETYNIGARCEKTTLEMVHAICRVLDEMHPQKSGDTYAGLIELVEDRPGHDKRYAIDPTKLEQELGWAPSTSFSNGLVQTIAWHLTEYVYMEREIPNLRRRGLGSKT